MRKAAKLFLISIFLLSLIKAYKGTGIKDTLKRSKSESEEFWYRAFFAIEEGVRESLRRFS